MTFEQTLQQQVADWPKHREAGQKGNPWATLCMRCYGRHAPPHGDICPNEPPSSNGELQPEERK